VKVAIGALDFVALALAAAVGVATAAMVWSNCGVVVYLMRSVANETLEKGRLEIEDAPGNANRSGAGADGFKEARSKSPGLNTLK
jgi:hypothetical protein